MQKYNIMKYITIIQLWGVRQADKQSKTVTKQSWIMLSYGYKTPVLTSQETHHISATEPSRLILYKIWGLHGSDYEECRILGYNSVRTSQ
jgi:hypothetical protein